MNQIELKNKALQYIQKETNFNVEDRTDCLDFPKLFIGHAPYRIFIDFEEDETKNSITVLFNATSESRLYDFKIRFTNLQSFINQFNNILTKTVEELNRSHLNRIQYISKLFKKGN